MAEADDPAGALRTIARLLRTAIIIALALVALWLVGELLFVLFAGVIFAVFLRAVGHGVCRVTGFAMPWSVSAVIAAIICAIVGGFFVVVPRVVDQANLLASRLAQAVDKISQVLSGYFPQFSLGGGQAPDISPALSKLFAVTTSATSVVAAAFIIIFVGVYLSLTPSLYINGFVRLLPPVYRDRVRGIMFHAGHSLQWWLVGRAINMAAVGLITAIGLTLLGIPLAITLAVLAGLLTFIPYVGALVSAVPAVLLAFMKGPAFALYVAGIYLIAHVVEGYVLAPLVQQRMVHLPAALLLAAQVIIGALFGVLGVTLAAPLTVILMVVTSDVYRPVVLKEGKPPPQIDT